MGDGKAGEGDAERQGDRGDDASLSDHARQLAGQENDGGDRAGSGDQGNGERKGRDIGNVLIFCDSPIGALLMTLLAPFEDEFEPDPEKEQAAGDPKRTE